MELFMSLVPKQVSLYTWFDDLVVEAVSDESEGHLVEIMEYAITLLVTSFGWTCRQRSRSTR